jgi:hypothetical protein
MGEVTENLYSLCVLCASVASFFAVPGTRSAESEMLKTLNILLSSIPETLTQIATLFLAG